MFYFISSFSIAKNRLPSVHRTPVSWMLFNRFVQTENWSYLFSIVLSSFSGSQNWCQVLLFLFVIQIKRERKENNFHCFWQGIENNFGFFVLSRKKLEGFVIFGEKQIRLFFLQYKWLHCVCASKIHSSLIGYMAAILNSMQNKTFRMEKLFGFSSKTFPFSAITFLYLSNKFFLWKSVII